MNGRNLGAEIRAARNDARLTLRQVGDALARTAEWVRQIESGILQVKPEKARRILDAIARLKEIHDGARAQLGKDLSAALEAVNFENSKIGER